MWGVCVWVCVRGCVWGVCVYTQAAGGLCVWGVCGCVWCVCVYTQRLQGACGWPVEDRQGGLRPLLARREVAPLQAPCPSLAVRAALGCCEHAGPCGLLVTPPLPTGCRRPSRGVTTRLSPDLVPGPGVEGQSCPSSGTPALCSERQVPGWGPPLSLRRVWAPGPAPPTPASSVPPPLRRVAPLTGEQSRPPGVIYSPVTVLEI